MLRYLDKENQDDFFANELDRSIICDDLGIDFIQRSYPNQSIVGHTPEEEMMIMDESVECLVQG